MTLPSPTRRGVAFAAAVLLAAAAHAGPPATGPATADGPPDYSAQAQVARLPFANRVDFDRLRSMYVRVSIDGGPPLSLQVDTGSVGVIVGADDVPHVDPHAPPGSINYVSSGNEMDGVWTPVTLTFVDARDDAGRPVTATVPVLAAQGYKFHPGAINGGRAAATKPATTRLATTRVAATRPRSPRPRMLGVGFNRGPDSHPERNPFLNLAAMRAGTMRRGYAITRGGIDLGLAPSDTAAGYLFEKLASRPVSPEAAHADPALRDWVDGQGAITVGTAPPTPVGILIDTGLTNLMVELPTVAANADVAPGTPVTVDLLGGRLHYHFTAGDRADPLAPSRVSYMPWPHPPLLNTGLRALAGYDYLYDADGGYLALRPTRPRP